MCTQNGNEREFENLKEITELEVKGLGDRLGVVHKGWKIVKKEPQVSLPSSWGGL